MEEFQHCSKAERNQGQGPGGAVVQKATSHQPSAYSHQEGRWSKEGRKWKGDRWTGGIPRQGQSIAQPRESGTPQVEKDEE